MQALAIYLYVFLHTTFCGCGKDRKHTSAEKLNKAYCIAQVNRLQPELTESSGFVLLNDSTLLSHNDGGSKPELFLITPEGAPVARKEIEQVRNRDWEDLARDRSGHVYIGDFGNNLNNRKNLTIYKIREEDFGLVGEIKFSYPDQTGFPPPKNNLNFDTEAFFWLNDTLHLFSKDRSPRRMTKHYKVPDAPGQYVASLTDSLRLNTMITGASISPDQQTAALLGYGKIFIFQLSQGTPILKSPHGCIPFPGAGQAEAIAFINNTDLIFSNEQGKLFLVRKR